jgi:hypothetical protein
MADPIADVFEAAEKALTEWGFVCRRSSEALGLPRSSSIQAMIEHVRREDSKRKDVSSKAMTAAGKQKKPLKLPPRLLDSKILSTDEAVAGLPGWGKKIIKRAFLFGQPNRVACRQIGMRPGEYEQRKRSAVELVAECLADRYSASSTAREVIARFAAP